MKNVFNLLLMILNTNKSKPKNKMILGFMLTQKSLTDFVPFLVAECQFYLTKTLKLS